VEMSRRQLKREIAQLTKELSVARSKLKKRKLKAKKLAEMYMSIVLDEDHTNQQKGQIMYIYVENFFKDDRLYLHVHLKLSHIITLNIDFR